MQMTLEKWQERLECNFAKLAKVRSGSDLPIFALEHDLTEQEIVEFTTFMRSCPASILTLRNHWLAWAVYASEKGYEYTGAEYWRSFEYNTPGWEVGFRNEIRGCFLRFQKRYNGVSPSGAWADHFRIIAWPITHSILPLYLQRHLAQALYELRFQLVNLTSIEPTSVGRLIAAYVYHSSARFEEFLQQEELVGRIVLALVGKDHSEGNERLLETTLKRIVGDLVRVRESRDWLTETRIFVSDRFKGMAQGIGPHGSRSHISSEGRNQQRKVNIKPDIHFRYTKEDSWTLVVDVPSFKGLATLEADIREFLRTTRCSLNGGEGMRPAGWVMSSNRKAVLKSWPDPKKPLVCFDRHQSVVEGLLMDECRMTRGPIWVFRIGGDGIAREIVGRSVRPGFDYIIATKDSISNLLDDMHECPVKCNGIKAIRISVPQDVHPPYITWLNKNGLDVARTIRVWPAGLPARNWDGQGRGEWLTTEQPCVGIVHDHPVDFYEISLNQKAMKIVPAGKVGHPKFIRLWHLDAGMYRLNVKAHKSRAHAGTRSKAEHDAYLDLRVREPEPWIPGITSHAGLILSGVPHDANLGTFWENKYPLSVSGPKNRSITATVTLESRKGEELLCEKIFDSVALPIMQNYWKERFDDFLKRKKCAGRHLEASAGILRIDGQELGKTCIRFEHEALPLILAYRRERNKHMVRLVDDRGVEGSDLKCHFFGVEQPLKDKGQKVDDFLTGFEVQSPGGLLVVQSKDHQDCIIVSPVSTEGGLRGLDVSCDYGTVRGNPRVLAEIFRILGYWQNARLTDIVAAARQKKIVDGLLKKIFGVICGSGWVKSETEFLSSFAGSRTKGKRKKKKLPADEKLQAKIGDFMGFGPALRLNATTIPSNLAAITEWYTDLAKRYYVCDDPELCAFVIRLVSNPYRVPQFLPRNMEELIGRLVKCPALLRGARFAALLCTTDANGVRTMNPRWEE